MNKTLLALSTLSSLSFPVLAVVNGTPVDWTAQDNAVRFDSQQTGREGLCTGTLIAGRYVITAAHCLKEEELDSFTTSTQNSYSSDTYNQHPDYEPDEDWSIDVGIVTADALIDYTAIQYFDTHLKQHGEAISIAGFGGTIETLNSVDLTFRENHWSYRFKIIADVVDENSHTTTGDSGAAWLNSNDEIIGIHKGSKVVGDDPRETYGTDVNAMRNFITDTVDGWHYPTVADSNGRTTITVQSLHVNEVSDSAYTEGDATLITEDSTCITQGPIDAFEKCTYVIESQGGEGKLYLTADEVISLNLPEPEPEPNPESDSGSSGGSVGFLSLFGLALLRLRRKS